MKRETLIAVAVAVVFGLVAVYLANVYLTGRARHADANELTRVAVATIPLDYGTELTPDKVRFAAYPKSSLPPGSFTSAEELFPRGEKRVVLTTIAVNEPLLTSKISGPGTNASIAALLPAGMRAASVRINDVSGVAGFVQPNDSVDVLITRQFNNGNDSQQITDLLLQNVRVLAIGQQSQGAEGKPITANTATLQVDPLAAQKLALAQEIGSLSLVLRKPGQQEDMIFQTTVSMADLRFGRSGNLPPQAAAVRPVAVAQPVRPASVRRTQPAPRPAPAKVSNSVEVVRGTTGAQYEVGGNGN